MQINQVTKKSKVMAGIGHLTPYLGFMIPLVSLFPVGVYWLWRRKKSEYENHHLKSAFNFHVGMTFLILVTLFLAVIVTIALSGKGLDQVIQNYASYFAVFCMGLSALGALVGSLFAFLGKKSPYPGFIGLSSLREKTSGS